MKVSPRDQAELVAVGVEHLDAAEIGPHDVDGRVENLFVKPLPVAVRVIEEQAADLLQLPGVVQFAGELRGLIAASGLTRGDAFRVVAFHRPSSKLD
jgi:hypothetical protein